MKKILPAFLAALILLSATACSGARSSGSPASRPPFIPSDDRVPETQTPTKEPGPPSQAPAGGVEITSDLILGVYYEAANTYENHFIGVGCRLDEDWEVYDEDQIAALNGLMVDLMTDESLAYQLENSGSLMPFYAQANSGLITLNITVENLGRLYGSSLDEQGYVELALGQISPALEAIGLTDITTEVGSIVFAGDVHAAVRISSSMQGIPFYETLVCMKIGNYIVNITAASYTENVTGEVLSLFYSL